MSKALAFNRKLNKCFVFCILVSMLLHTVSINSMRNVLPTNDYVINNPLPMYFAPRFFVEDDIVYVFSSGGIEIMNNSDPTKLELLGMTAYKETDYSVYRSFLTKYSNLIFCIRKEHYWKDNREFYWYFEIYDVEDLSEPKFLGDVFLHYTTNPEHHPSFGRYGNGVIVLDNDIYFIMARGNHPIVINCSSLTNPVRIEDYSFPTELQQYYRIMDRFYIRNNLVITPTRNESSHIGFVVFNMTSLQTCSKVTQWFGEVNITGVYRLFANQDILYLHDYSGGEVFDISNLTAPTRIGYINTKNYYNPIILDNSFFVSALDDTAGIYNYTDTRNITEICSYSMPIEDNGEFHTTEIDESKIAGNRIYLPRYATIYENKTLLILKWSAPNNLEFLSLIGFPYYYTSMRFAITSKPIIITSLIFTVFIYQIYLRKKKRKTSQ